jgi:hypothetical protein
MVLMLYSFSGCKVAPIAALSVNQEGSRPGALHRNDRNASGGPEDARILLREEGPEAPGKIVVGVRLRQSARGNAESLPTIHRKPRTRGT